MNIEKNISKTNLDSNEALKKENSNLEHEELTEDLKNSLYLAIENTSDIFRDLQNTIDSKIGDVELKKQTEKIMSHLHHEFKESVKNAQGKMVNTYKENSFFKEEE